MAFGQVISANTGAGLVAALSSAAITTSSGQLMAIGIDIKSTAQTLASITDTYGNTWIKGPANLTAGSDVLYGYYAQNITGGAGHVITVNIAGGTANLSFVVMTFTGRATSSALDKAATFSLIGTFGTSHAGASATTANASEDLFAFNFSAGATAADTFTAGSGWTIPSGGQNPGNGASYCPSFVEYQAAVAVGTYAGAYTTGNYVQGAGLIMTFNSSSGIPTTGGAGMLMGVG
jgi:hypothetical protein